MSRVDINLSPWRCLLGIRGSESALYQIGEVRHINRKSMLQLSSRRLSVKAGAEVIERHTVTSSTGPGRSGRVGLPLAAASDVLMVVPG